MIDIQGVFAIRETVSLELMLSHLEVLRHLNKAYAMKQGWMQDLLTAQYGKGFSRSNVFYMRKLYLSFQNSETLSHKLSWSHFQELLSICSGGYAQCLKR